MLGAFIMAVGFLGSAFVTDLYTLYVTFGIIGGEYGGYNNDPIRDDTSGFEPA